MSDRREQLQSSGRWLINAVNAFNDSGAWASLPPAAKSVLFPLLRRGDAEGKSFSGISRIARDAGISRRTAIRGLSELAERDLLGSSGPVKSDAGDWATSTRQVVPPLTLGSVMDDHTPSAMADPRGSVTSGTGVVSPVAHKESQLTVTSEKPQILKTAAIAAESDLEAIYQLYPRKVKKDKALPAIAKALQKIQKRGEANPVKWLSERVQAFAASPAGQAGKFCPYPASWMNAGQFDDDPQEWQRSGDAMTAKPNKRDGEYSEDALMKTFCEGTEE